MPRFILLTLPPSCFFPLFLVSLSIFLLLATNSQARSATKLIAGNGTNAFGGDSGPATSAALNLPKGLWLDSNNNLFICDAQNYRIRRVDNLGIISSFGGTGISNTSSHGGVSIINASFKFPYVITGDTLGSSLYLSDAERVWVYSFHSGIVSVLAGTTHTGNTGDGGPVSSALLGIPTGLWLTSSGSLFIVDSGYCRVRVISLSSGLIDAYAGTLGGCYHISVYYGDGGPATSATLSSPMGMWVNSAGIAFIADTNNFRIRRVDGNGIITTFAGNGQQGDSGDNGPATLAMLNLPSDVKGDTKGNIFIADMWNSKIRMVNTAMIITTLVGTAGEPVFLWFDPMKSQLYVSEENGIVEQTTIVVKSSDSKSSPLSGKRIYFIIIPIVLGSALLLVLLWFYILKDSQGVHFRWKRRFQKEIGKQGGFQVVATSHQDQQV